MTTPNNDHLTALETYESVRDFFEPHLQRQWDKVLRSTRRSAFAAAYDAIVNADQWPDGADALNEAYWATVHVYKATLDVLGDFTPDHPVDVPDVTTTCLTTTCLTTRPTTSDAHVVLQLLAPIFGAYFQPCRRALWTLSPATCRSATP